MYSTRIGHAHLKVRDLDRAVSFYTRAIRLHETERVDQHYAFLTGGDLHHEIALQAVGPDAPSPTAGATGLYHVAFEVPNRRQFAEAWQALTQDGISVATVDHYISWAMYFDDPDGNGLEIYCDTRRDPDGRTLWQGINRPLTPERLLSVLDQPGR